MSDEERLGKIRRGWADFHEDHDVHFLLDQLASARREVEAAQHEVARQHEKEAQYVVNLRTLAQQVEQLREALGEYRWALDRLIPKGQCWTVPNGSCVGHGCIHDPGFVPTSHKAEYECNDY